MHKHLFEYAVVRVVPQVEREEFINVGVVLYCKEMDFLATNIYLNQKRLFDFSPVTDPEDIRENLNAFAQIAKGIKDGGIGEMCTPERFRWLTATRSTVVQCSKVHPGFCAEPKLALEKLFEEMVG